MTKDEFIALIAGGFNTGQENFITGSKIYNAFYMLCDMVFGASGTGRNRGVCNVNTNPGTPEYGDYYMATYNAGNAQVFTSFGLTVQTGELCIFKYTTYWSKLTIGTITGTGGTGTMTAAEIRDALMTLSAFDRLSKSAILHGEGALNYLGEDNFSSMVYTGDIYKGDLFFHSGTSSAFKNGDWAIALADGASTAGIASGSGWLVIAFGKWNAAFSADIDGNVTFEKNIKVKGQAYSEEHAVTIIPTDAIYEEYTPNFDNGNVFRLTSQRNILLKNPTNKKNGSTFLIVIRADALISIAFESDFLELNTISLQPAQTIIISGLISNSQILCDQGKIFGATAVQNAPILDTVVINSADAETGSRGVLITPTFAGGGTPTSYAVKEDSGLFGEWIAYVSGNINYDIQSSNEGTKTLYVKFKNSANEESEAKYDQILLVENEPSLTGIAINNGSASTTIRNVQVYLQGISGLGVKQVRLSNDGTTWGSWVTYLGSPLSHTLTETNGTKTVYLQIKNIAGTQATTYNDTIELTTIGNPDLLSIAINEEATETSSRTIEIVMTIGSGTTPTHYAIQENGGSFGSPIAYEDETISHDIVHSGDGAKTIGLKLLDASSNESTVRSANILLVTEAAALGGISINNGDGETQSKNIQISFNSVTGYGQKEIAVSESEVSLSTWVLHNVNTAYPFTLSTGNGLKTVFAQVRNIAGASATKSDGISLNEITSVILTAFALNGGNTATNQVVPISFTASGNPDKYMISENSDFSGASWQDIASSNNFTLSRTNGLKTVYFKVKNNGLGYESSPMQVSILMQIAVPTVSITSITGTTPNITINSVATNAYKMKVLELDEGAIPNWASVSEVDYNAAKTHTITGSGNRLIHVQVISYGDGTVTDSELFTISLALLNTFKIAFARSNANQIGTTTFYGFDKYTAGSTSKIKNTAGALVGASGSEITLEFNASDGTIGKVSSGATSFTDEFPTSPDNVMYNKLHCSKSSGNAPGYIQLRLFNLNTAHKFNFKFATSTSSAAANVHQPLKFEVTGAGSMVSDTITTVKDNTSEIAEITNVSPNASGEIYIKYFVDRGTPYDFYSYGALCASIIEQYG